MSMTPAEVVALLAEPALAPPAGVTADFVNPPNENGLGWFVTTFCLVIATLSLIIRAYTKLRLAREVRIEDILVLGAFGAFLSTIYAGYRVIFTCGYYVHQWDLRNKDIVEPSHLLLIYSSGYPSTLALTKSAILLDWCRIFVPGSRTKSVFWWGSMFIVFIQLSSGIVTVVLMNTVCDRNALIWGFNLTGRCTGLTKVMLASASIQVFSDSCMVLLPQKMIWGLQMNWRKKIGVSIVFGVGALAIIAACFRLSTTITYTKEDDEMYYVGPLLFWACAEMTCGFFIFCVPCIPRIIKEVGVFKAIKSIFSTSPKSYNNTPNHTSKMYDHTDTLASKKRLKTGTDPNDAYYNIDEEEVGLPLEIIKTSESKEQLHNPPGDKTMKVMRTTQTVVTSDSHSTQSERDLGAKVFPWSHT